MRLNSLRLQNFRQHVDTYVTFDAGLTGPSMRSLEAAAPVTSVDAREVHQAGGGEEMTSP